MDLKGKERTELFGRTTERKVDGDAMGRRVIDIDGRCEAERRDAGFLSSVHKKVAVQPSKNSFAQNIF